MKKFIKVENSIIKVDEIQCVCDIDGELTVYFVNSDEAGVLLKETSLDEFYEMIEVQQ